MYKELKNIIKCNYICQDFNKYMTQETDIHYSSKVSSNCMIGMKTFVDEFSNIRNCVIGNNCKIGKNV